MKFLVTKKEVTGRIARCILTLSEFTFDIIHIKGTENSAADELTRYDVFAKNLDSKDNIEQFSVQTINDDYET